MAGARLLSKACKKKNRKANPCLHNMLIQTLIAAILCSLSLNPAYSYKLPSPLKFDLCSSWSQHASITHNDAGGHRDLQRSRPFVSMATSVPRDVKDTLGQLRQSMQAGLSSRCSRMDIELPYAVNLGIERSKTENSQVD